MYKPLAGEPEKGSDARTARSNRFWLHGKHTFALQFLAGQLAGAADSLSLFASALHRGLLIVIAQLHFMENALALQLFLERLEGLIDIIVANENLHSDVLGLGHKAGLPSK